MSGEQVGIVAACMAKGLTPEQTDKVMGRLFQRRVPERASDIQRAIQDAIDRVISEPSIPILPPTVLKAATK